ncbi:SusC/RagA family TonB-linked outer membrane protein [Niabella insulamsoli]|uniref:SusC/RagA family TonB-linked outer membrane protein n=1 Tax=Niabella insulamsoli TaxID=3144874 RepID=UPI0031FD1098
MNHVPLLEVISGVVVDEEGIPISGASISIKNTSLGTSTDSQGIFKIDVASETDVVLIVSYIGKKETEYVVTDFKNIRIVLADAESSEDEVVVIGYGTQKKVNVTAAVATVDTKVLDNRPVKSLGEMLQGAAANLNIGLSSGAPDATPSFNIRGFTGINASGQPLILVDGAEQDPNLINPMDIASISVLKDQAASAIYGSRAPNGVILITTKSGTRDATPSVNYAANVDFNSPSRLQHTMNSVSYARLTNQAFQNSQQAPYYTEDIIANMQAFIDGTGPNNTKLANGLWGAHNTAHGNTDYFGEAFKKVSSNVSHNLNVSGGSKSSTYYLGLGYNTKEGILNTKFDEFDRLSAILKLESSVTKWMNLRFETRFAQVNTLRPNFRSGSNYTNSEGSDDTFIDQLSYFPNIPTKNPDGSYHFLSSLTLLTGDQGSAKNRNTDLWLVPSLTITPFKGLTLRTSYNQNLNFYNSFITTFQVFTDRGNGVLSRTARSATYDGIGQQDRFTNYYQWDGTATYNKSFASHNLTLLAGFQQELNKFEATTKSRRELYDNEVPTFSTAYGDEMSITDTRYNWATRGYFFRTSYNYKSKYLFDFNSRYDASSRFSPQTRWAFFPSISAGYNISKEAFWPFKFINNFKITGSWGRSGEPGTGTSNAQLYTYISALEASRNTALIINNAFQPQVGSPRIINDNLTWAKPQTIGFGLEWGMLKNRLQGEWYWYQRTVYDQFSPPELLPEVLGAAVPNSNDGVSETRGWEFTLQWEDVVRNVMGSPLRYSIKGMLSDYIGYVVSYGQGNPTGLVSGTWTAGEPFGVINGYRSEGIASDLDFLKTHVPANNNWFYQGDLYLKDNNQDGKIDAGQGGYWYSRGDIEKLGYNYPRYKYSMFFTLDWKNLSLNTLLDGVGSQQYYASSEEIMGLSGGSWDGRTAYQWHADLGYWSLNNQNAFFPRPYQGTKVLGNINDQYLINLSHLRIRNINLGYNFNKLSKYHIQNLMAYVSLENIGFIYTKSWLRADPNAIEQGMRGYPFNKVVSLGLKISLK